MDEQNKVKYHVYDTIKHVSTLQQLFLVLLDKIDEPSNLLKMCQYNINTFKLKEDTLSIIINNTINSEEPFNLHRMGIRILSHDMSKLTGLEYEGYKDVVYKLSGLEYGTPEHKEAIKELDKAFKLHASINSHHPEFYENGILDFTLYNLIEMILDWCSAAICRGFKFKLSSVKDKQDKLGYDDELLNIIIENVKLILPEDKIEFDI